MCMCMCLCSLSREDGLRQCTRRRVKVSRTANATGKSASDSDAISQGMGGGECSVQRVKSGGGCCRAVTVLQGVGN